MLQPTSSSDRRDVVLCECFARDGLQHEAVILPTPTKVALIDAFTDAGFQRIEATSYSRPDAVPGFADGSAVLAAIKRGQGVYYKATCPNPKAVTRALQDADAGHGANELSLLVSATEEHTKRNLNSTREQQWERVAEMVTLAGDRFRLIGVISVALGCPIEGAVDEGSVVADVARFANLGVRYVVFGDTTGLGTPRTVASLFKRVLREVPAAIPVAHFHNTHGTGIANCLAALDAGCTHFDSAIGGVGGHPTKIVYGEGITGNVATEDLVNILEAENVATGLDLDRLMRASKACEASLGRSLNSMVAKAGYGLLPAMGGVRP